MDKLEAPCSIAGSSSLHDREDLLKYHLVHIFPFFYNLLDIWEHDSIVQNECIVDTPFPMLFQIGCFF